MEFIAKRFVEPSTWAGIAAVAHGLSLLLTNWLNPQGWIETVGGVNAILMRERGNAA